MTDETPESVSDIGYGAEGPVAPSMRRHGLNCNIVDFQQGVIPSELHFVNGSYRPQVVRGKRRDRERSRIDRLK
jgi:hypothetical protein